MFKRLKNSLLAAFVAAGAANSESLAQDTNSYYQAKFTAEITSINPNASIPGLTLGTPLIFTLQHRDTDIDLDSSPQLLVNHNLSGTVNFLNTDHNSSDFSVFTYNLPNVDDISVRSPLFSFELADASATGFGTATDFNDLITQLGLNFPDFENNQFIFYEPGGSEFMFGGRLTGAELIHVIPEPATLTFFIMGGTVFVFANGRRKQHNPAPALDNS